MINMSRSKVLMASLAALSLAACSSGYDRYGNATDSANSYGYYADSTATSRYGTDSGAYMYGGCATTDVYSGGYTQTGLRTGRYGNPTIATGNVEFYGQSSRYGSWESGASAASNCMSGYWAAPTYQVITQPPPAVTTSVPEAIVTPTVTTPTILESCPDGQYRMDNGDCAIMMTEEVDQYVPPVTVTHYPKAPAVTHDWYEPIRK